MRRLMILAVTLAGLAAGPAFGDTLAEVKAGNAAFGEGRYEAAVDAYTKAILAGDLQPEALAVTFNNRGVAYSELGDYDRAIQDYNQALSLRPGDKTSIKNLRIGYSRRAMAHANLGEYDQALADYAKAIEIDPQNGPTYVRRAQLYLDRGSAPAAIADLNKAKELDPTNREVAQLLTKAEASVASATPAPAAAPPTESTPGEMQAADTTATAPAAMAPPQTTTTPPDAAAPAQPPTANQPTKPATASDETQPRPRPPVKVTAGEPHPYRVLQSVNYREGPGNDYAKSGSLAAGSVINVVGESKGWLMIQLQSGKQGFVYRRYLEPVQE